jgi:hypothetical protein
VVTVGYYPSRTGPRIGEPDAEGLRPPEGGANCHSSTSPSGDGVLPNSGGGALDEAAGPTLPVNVGSGARNDPPAVGAPAYCSTGLPFSGCPLPCSGCASASVPGSEPREDRHEPPPARPKPSLPREDGRPGGPSGGVGGGVGPPRCNEKGVRLAQKIQVGPYIPVEIPP